MILADSNIIIYAASGQYPQVTEWFAKNVSSVSAISLVEVLGYHNLKSAEKTELENLFSDLTILYPSPDVFQKAITLRQQKKMSLGDALVAATAIQNNLTLATHNTPDFNWIKTLELIDPVIV
jgi:toxin FitB